MMSKRDPRLSSIERKAGKTAAAPDIANRAMAY